MNRALHGMSTAAPELDQRWGNPRDQIVPAITALPGFQSSTWLTGNDSGLGLSLTAPQPPPPPQASRSR